MRLAILATALLLPTAASSQGTPAPKEAYLYIISPADGDTVKGAFRCRFGLRNMGVTHAGDSFANSGHHHLLIDVDEPINPGEPIPQDKKHLHYGGGETEALIELPSGKHTLQLVLSDGKHFNFDPPIVSKKITITVRNDDEQQKGAHTVRNGHAGIRHHMTSREEEPTADEAQATQKPTGATGFLSRFMNGSK
jgi:hypothetical protein